MPEYVDGEAAAHVLLSFGTWRSGYCLEAVWQAYKLVGASTGMSAPTALSAFYQSGPARQGIPPAGVPVWWGAKPSSDAGDVVISLGGGRVVATDGAGVGRIGVLSVDQRTAQIARPYLGWTENIFDQKIAYEGRDDMALSDEDKRWIQDQIATGNAAVLKAIPDLLVGAANKNSERGKLGALIGVTAMRAKKAAERSAAILSLIQGSGTADLDTNALLAALKDLPAAVIKELKERL